MIERFHTSHRMSQVVAFPLSGKMIILAGQVASDKTLDVAGQTRNILARIDTLLAEAGATKDDLVSASIWLSDIATFNEMNSVWDSWVPAGRCPARACVEAKLADPALLVEIQVIAVKDAS